MNKTTGSIRANRQFVLAFFVLLLLAVGGVGYSIYKTTSDEKPPGHNRYMDKATSKGNHKPSTYQYAQEDIGYGDGSVAVEADGLSKQLFPFDPNTADSTQLLRLGLRPWQVRGIYRYRAHGGRYRKAEDFARVYGLTLAQYKRLKPYIRIKAEVMAADVVGQGSVEQTAPRTTYPKKLSATDAKVDINTADTTLLKRVPGIGSYFARKVVALRLQRKAFTSVEELLEIRNFPEAALAYMTISQTFPSLHVNTMSLQELQAHPLLTRTQANDIIALRRVSGRIASIEDLSLLNSFRPKQLSRLAPYIVF